jgi:hypothetical protein
MTEENKELLLKDLCARLPYHVRCKIWLKDGTTEEGLLDLEHNYGDVLQHAFYYNDIKDIKPYLRPMSSMTEEEKDFIRNKYFYEDWDSWNDLLHYHYHLINVEEIPEFMEWIYANHFDFLNLIEKGLAIEAPEGMYHTKK